MQEKSPNQLPKSQPCFNFGIGYKPTKDSYCLQATASLDKAHKANQNHKTDVAPVQG